MIIDARLKKFSHGLGAFGWSLVVFKMRGHDLNITNICFDERTERNPPTQSRLVELTVSPTPVTELKPM